VTSPRIIELRRRVERDPASIAFAQLAEEYRRAGEHEHAVQVCRAGLAQYPEYLSARVTLGRSLTELGRFDEARTELEHVLKLAPDNLAANRALDDLRNRTLRQDTGTASIDAAGTHGRADAPGHDTDAPLSARDRELLARLEAFLTAILVDRAEQSRRNATA
jgi:tetratricopeptide (TPR) repeat protein